VGQLSNEFYPPHDKAFVIHPSLQQIHAKYKVVLVRVLESTVDGVVLMDLWGPKADRLNPQLIVLVLATIKSVTQL
jgi:hypothetical protein